MWRPRARKRRCRRPHETALVHRLSPPSQDGRYGKPDALVKPEGPARDNSIAGPRTGTTRSAPSALASVPGPGSRPASACPAQPPSKAGGDRARGRGRHHGDGKANWSTESDRTGRGAAHQRGATRHAREARRRPQARHEDRCQATTATGCREPGKRAQHPTKRGTGQGAKESRAPTPAHRTHGQWEAGPGRTPEETGGRGWESARPRTPHTKARGAPPGALVPPPQHARARAVVLVTGSYARIPRHPQLVGSGPRQLAQRAGSGGWERARPRTPHTQAAGAPPGHPRAASTARKASSQERALWGW